MDPVFGARLHCPPDHIGIRHNEPDWRQHIQDGYHVFRIWCRLQFMQNSRRELRQHLRRRQDFTGNSFLDEFTCNVLFPDVARIVGVDQDIRIEKIRRGNTGQPGSTFSFLP
jgi:hypothetical protein